MVEGQPVLVSNESPAERHPDGRTPSHDQDPVRRREETSGGTVHVHVDGAVLLREPLPHPNHTPIGVLKKVYRGAISFLKGLSIVLAISLLVVLVLAVRRTALERKFRFSDIDVPTSFSEAGYTGSYVSRGIVDEMQRIRDSAGTLSPLRQVTRKDDRDLPPLNIQVQGQSIPLQAVVNAIWPKWSDSTLNVGGQLVYFKPVGELTIRVGTASRALPFTDKTGRVPHEILRQAAEFILQAAEPYVLASYFTNTDTLRARELLTRLTRSKQPRVRAQALTALVYLAEKTKDSLVSKESLLVLSRSADPTYRGAYVDLAAIYNRRRRNLEALHVLNAAPDGEHGWDALAASNRAGILNDLGRYSEGLRSAERAIALGDGFGPRLNAAKALVGLGRYEEAKVQFDHSLMFQPNANGVRFTKAMAFALHGDSAAARALSREVRRSDTTLTLAGQMLEAAVVSMDSALRIGRSSLSGQSSSRAAWLSILGEWLSVAQKHAEAKALLDEAATLDSLSPIVQWRAARAACWRGDKTEAQERFERFIALDDRRNGPPDIRISEPLCSPPVR